MMKRVQYDFGKEYQFQKEFFVGYSILDRLATGEAREIPCKAWDDKLVVYTGGEFPKVVYQRKRIPTFDVYDRESDSWHDLFLAQRKDGGLMAVYAMGGYRIANIAAWEQVDSIPDAIRRLLEE